MSANALQAIKKIFVGIDISKEKLNLCFRTASKIVCEEEMENTSTVKKTTEEELEGS